MSTAPYLFSVPDAARTLLHAAHRGPVAKVRKPSAELVQLIDAGYVEVRRGAWRSTMAGDAYLGETGRILEELRARLERAVDAAAPGETHEAATKALAAFDTLHPELPGAAPRSLP